MKSVEIVASSDCVEAGTGSNRLRDFFSSLLTSIGGALSQITEKEEISKMASTVSDLPHQRRIAGFFFFLLHVDSQFFFLGLDQN